MRNYFRYDSAIARDYYDAIDALERAQAARKRSEIRAENSARNTLQNVAQPLRAKAFNSTGFVS
jgi:hypothetical protein